MASYQTPALDYRRMRKLAAVMLLLFWLTFFLHPGVQAGQTTSPLPQQSADDVIAGVNALRAAYGLPAYAVSSILTTLCQNHADYMASSGNISDYDAQGRGSGALALALGYPLSGDTSLGGYISKNVYGGTNATAEDAISFWMGDSLHQIALLDPGFTETGAAVVQAGNIYYYCQVAAQPKGAPGAYRTPDPSLHLSTAAPSNNSVPSNNSIQPVAVVIVSTPNPDGSIVHIVHAGDTLYAISAKYGVPLTTIEQLNNITETTTIFTGNQLIIRPAFTPTFEPVISASTPVPTRLTLPSQPTETLPGTDSPPVAGLPASKAGTTVAIIIVSALLFSGLIIFASRKRA